MGVTIATPDAFKRFAQPGTSPLVAANTMRVRSFSGNPASVAPRIVEPENAAPGSLTYVEHIFANNQTLQLGQANKFAAFSGVGNLVFDGFFMSAGQFTGGGFKMSDGHYLEEGVVRLDSPFTRWVLGNHTPESMQLSRGVLDVVDDSGVGRFRIGQVDGTETFTRQTFDDVDMPVGDPLTVGSVATYAYYWFYRRYDSGAALHRSNLTINTTAAAEQTSTYGTPGDPGSDSWSVSGVTGQRAFVLWMRAGWEDTPGTSLANTPWANPRVYETTTFQAHGDFPITHIDGGSSGVYWRDIEMDLYLTQGATLEVRAVALDSPTNGLFDGLWDATDWIACSDTGPTNLYVSGAYPQGRYLLLQFRFTPSSTVTLSGATAFWYGDLRAIWSATSPPPPGDAARIPYAIRNSEGTASLAIPVTPHFAYRRTINGAARRFELEDGSARSITTATAERESYVLSWAAVTTAEKVLLQDFFDARGGGNEPFTFVDPAGTTRSVAWEGGDLQFEQLSPNAWRVPDINVVEVFSAS